jgi:hypothetical protein
MHPELPFFLAILLCGVGFLFAIISNYIGFEHDVSLILGILSTWILYFTFGMRVYKRFLKKFFIMGGSQSASLLISILMFFYLPIIYFFDFSAFTFFPFLAIVIIISLFIDRRYRG